MNPAIFLQRAACAIAAALAAGAIPLSSPTARAQAAERQLGQVRMGIDVMRADGTEARSLAVVGDRFHHGSPAWSPDGKQLAFDAYRSGFQDPAVFLCDADGSNLRQLAPGAYPRWSPDGTQIVLYSGLASGANPEISILDVTGSNRRRLTEGTFPDWSPDGKKIVFGRSGDDRGIWTIDADGSGLRQLASTEGDVLAPVWSPDGKRIAFSQAKGGDSSIDLIGSEGGAEQQLTTGDGHDFFANWSPDGKRIAFARYDRELREADVDVIDAAGSNLKALTSAPGYQIDPAFSPDGRWIAYGSER